MMEDFKGFRSVAGARRDDPVYRAKLKEVIDLISNKNGLRRHEREFLMYESLSTDDFPLLFGDVLDRQVLAAYREAPMVMPQIARKALLRDMRQVRRFEITDGDQRLTTVEELGEYPYSDRDEANYTYTPEKYGRKFKISWETILNDDLNALKDIPNRMGIAARRAEEFFLTSQFFDANGPLDSYFAGNGGQAAVDSLPLTIENLETAIEEMDNYSDGNSEPIDNTAKFLMIPPSLRFTAESILKATNKMYVISGDTDVAAVAYPTANVVAGFDMVILINRYMPRIITSGTVGNTAWALFADPNIIPACEFGKLQGRENPEIFMKTSNQQRVGGGDAQPMEGDWDSDAIEYKVRHVFGGTVLNGRAGWASDGQ